MALILFLLATPLFAQTESRCYTDALRALSAPDATGERLKTSELATPLLLALKLPKPAPLNQMTDRAWKEGKRLSDQTLKALWFPEKSKCPHPAMQEYLAIRRLLDTDLPKPQEERARNFTLEYVSKGVEIRDTLIKQMIYLSLLEKVNGEKIDPKKFQVIKDHVQAHKKSIHEPLRSGYPPTPDVYDRSTEEEKKGFRRSLRLELELAEHVRTQTRALIPLLSKN